MIQLGASRGVISFRDIRMTTTHNPKIDKHWFVAQLRLRDSDQKKLAHYLGLDPSAVSLMLNGRRAMRMEEAAKIAKYLGAPLDEVWSRAGMPVRELAMKKGKTTVAGRLDEKGIVSLGKVGDSPSVDAPANVTDDTIALRFYTALTSKDQFDGWVVYVRWPTDRVHLEAIGRLCLVETEDGELRLRFVRRSHDKGTYTLLSLCGQQVETARITKAQPIAWIQP